MAKTLPLADPLAAIRHLYFTTTRKTIERDFAQALALLKAMPSEEERSRATVYMHGLAQMRAQWTGQGRKAGRKGADNRAEGGAGKKTRG